MGVHFRPGGAFPFLGFSAHEFANKHVDLDCIWGCSAGKIRERLADASSPRHRFRLLENVLLTRLRRPLEHHPAVSLALIGFKEYSSVGSENSHAVVRKLARAAGVCDRRFFDVFRSEVGLNPKLFHRVQRFQHTLIKARRLQEPNWAQLALEDGYFDQSHLIRDFLAFSGFSPADYLRQLKELREKGLRVKFNHLPVSE